MNHKTTLYIIVTIITIGALAEYLMNGISGGIFWGIIALVGWVLTLTSKSPPPMETSDEIEEVSPKYKKENKSGIPGYKESEEDMAACYNCDFSRNIDNRTFVECKKYQQKVYRKNICDDYKS